MNTTTAVEEIKAKSEANKRSNSTGIYMLRRSQFPVRIKEKDIKEEEEDMMVVEDEEDEFDDRYFVGPNFYKAESIEESSDEDVSHFSESVMIIDSMEALQITEKFVKFTAVEDNDSDGDKVDDDVTDSDDHDMEYITDDEEEGEEADYDDDMIDYENIMRHVDEKKKEKDMVVNILTDEPDIDNDADDEELNRRMNVKILKTRTRPKSSNINPQRLPIALEYANTLIEDAKAYKKHLTTSYDKLKHLAARAWYASEYEDKSNAIIEEEGDTSTLSGDDISKLLHTNMEQLEIKRRMHAIRQSFACINITLETLEHISQELEDSVDLYNIGNEPMSPTNANSDQKQNSNDEDDKEEEEAKPYVMFVFSKPLSLYLRWCFDKKCRVFSPYHKKRWREFRERSIKDVPEFAKCQELFSAVIDFGRIDEENGDVNEYDVKHVEALGYVKEHAYEHVCSVFDYLLFTAEKCNDREIPATAPLFVRYASENEFQEYVYCVNAIFEAFDPDAPRPAAGEVEKPKGGFKKYSDDYKKSRTHALDRKNEFVHDGATERNTGKVGKIKLVPIALTPHPGKPLAEKAAAEAAKANNTINQSPTTASNDSKMLNIKEALKRMRVAAGYADTSELKDARWITYSRGRRVYPDVFDMWCGKPKLHARSAREKESIGEFERRLVKTEPLKFIMSHDRLVESTAYRWFGVKKMVEKDRSPEKRHQLIPVQYSKAIPKLRNVDEHMKASPNILFSLPAFLYNANYSAPRNYRIACYSELVKLDRPALRKYTTYALIRIREKDNNNNEDDEEVDVARWLKVLFSISLAPSVLRDAFGNVLNDVPDDALLLIVPPNNHSKNHPQQQRRRHRVKPDKRSKSYSAIQRFFTEPLKPDDLMYSEDFIGPYVSSDDDDVLNLFEPEYCEDNLDDDQQVEVEEEYDDEEYDDEEEEEADDIELNFPSRSVCRSNWSTFEGVRTEKQEENERLLSVGFRRSLWNHGYSSGVTVSLKCGEISLDTKQCDELWSNFTRSTNKDYEDFVKVVNPRFIDNVFEKKTIKSTALAQKVGGYSANANVISYFEDKLHLPVCYEYKRGVRAMPYTNEKEVIEKYLELTKSHDNVIPDPHDVYVHAGIVSTACDRHIHGLTAFANRNHESDAVLFKKTYRDDAVTRIHLGKPAHPRDDLKNLPQLINVRNLYENLSLELDFGGLSTKDAQNLTGYTNPPDCNRNNINRLVSTWESLQAKLLERFECNTTVISLQDKFTNGRSPKLMDDTLDETYAEKPPMSLYTLLTHETIGVMDFRNYCTDKRDSRIAPIYLWCNNLQRQGGGIDLYQTNNGEVEKTLHWMTLEAARTEEGDRRDMGMTTFNCLRKGIVNDVSQMTMDVSLEKDIVGTEVLSNASHFKYGHAHLCNPESVCAVVIDLSEAYYANVAYLRDFQRINYRNCKTDKQFGDITAATIITADIKAKFTNKHHNVAITDNTIKKAKKLPTTQSDCVLILDKTSLSSQVTKPVANNKCNKGRCKESVRATVNTPNMEYEYVKYHGKEHRAKLVEANAPWASSEGIVVSERAKNIKSPCFQHDGITGYEIHNNYLGDAEHGSKIWPDFEVPTQKKQAEVQNCFFVDRQPCYNLNSCYLSSLTMKYAQKYKATCKSLLITRFGNDAKLFFAMLLRHLDATMNQPRWCDSAAKYADKYILVKILEICTELEKWDGKTVKYDNHSKCRRIKHDYYRNYKNTREATVRACKRAATAMGLLESKIISAPQTQDKHMLNVLVDLMDKTCQHEYVQNNGTLSDETLAKQAEKLKVVDEVDEGESDISNSESHDRQYCAPCAVERRIARCLARTYLETLYVNTLTAEEKELQQTCNDSAQYDDVSNVQYHIGCQDHIKRTSHTEIPHMCTFNPKDAADKIAEYDLVLKWLLKLSPSSVLSTAEEDTVFKDPKKWMNIHECVKTGT